MELYYTGVVAVLAIILWVFSGVWEWHVPMVIEHKLTKLNKTANYKAFFQLKKGKSLYEHEQFAYYIKSLLSQLEQELGHPIHVEVVINEVGRNSSEEEKRYITCLGRLFSEFSWLTSKDWACNAKSF